MVLFFIMLFTLFPSVTVCDSAGGLSSVFSKQNLVSAEWLVLYIHSSIVLALWQMP